MGNPQRNRGSAVQVATLCLLDPELGTRSAGLRSDSLESILFLGSRNVGPGRAEGSPGDSRVAVAVGLALHLVHERAATLGVAEAVTLGAVEDSDDVEEPDHLVTVGGGEVGRLRMTESVPDLLLELVAGPAVAFLLGISSQLLPANGDEQRDAVGLTAEHVEEDVVERVGLGSHGAGADGTKLLLSSVFNHEV